MEEHRRAQAALVANLIRELTILWPSFGKGDQEILWPILRRAIYLLVVSRHRTSSGLAAAYYQRIREAHGITGNVVPTMAPDLPDPLITTTLDITGPSSFNKSLTRGKTEEQAKARALVEVAGSATKLVLDGGRTTTVETSKDDKLSIGWARMTDGDPCSWCAMLASRGPVFHSAQSAGLDNQWHPHCACVPVPVFSRDDPWPGKAQEYRDLWYASKDDAEDGDLLNAFRRAYEAKQRA
jgi:hypothetical protein